MTDTDANTSLAESRVSSLLESISAKAPTPGGGAVSPMVGALAGALAGMVVAYSQGKKSLAEYAELHADYAQRLVRSRQLLIELAEEDARAYQQLQAAQKRVKDALGTADETEAKAAHLAAARDAIAVPLSVVAACADLVRVFEVLAPVSNTWLLSDLAVSTELTLGAAKASWWMVQVNAGELDRLGATQPAGSEELVRAQLMIDEMVQRVSGILAQCG